MDFIPDSFAPPLSQAFSLIDKSSMDASELEAQHKRKAFIFIQKSSLALVEERGIEQGIEKVARNMLENGMPVVLQVSQLTGLNEERVSQLI